MLLYILILPFFFTYFKEKKEDINQIGEKNHFIKSFARIGASSVVGIGMAAFVIAAAYYSLQFGKNEFTNPSWDIVARFDFFDIEDLPAAFPDILPYAEGCTYADCSHVGEGISECAVARAAAEGKIAPSRLESYRSVWRTLKNKAQY